jgi:carboxymethylenebutenolidase
MKDSILAGTIELTGVGGDQIDAYAALPQTRSSVGGVVVIHHMPGFDWGSKEIVRRFAAWGYAAVCPNLHYREAPGADPDDAAAASRRAGGVPDERLIGDVAAAREYLLSADNSNRRIGVIGFCSGGRQSVLAATALPFDAAVDCYGAFVTSSAPAESGLTMSPLTDRLPDLHCPLLGLFGNDDKNPSPPEVDELDRILSDHDLPHEFHRFDGAGHAFFNVMGPSYRPEVAVRGWQLIKDFYARHLGAPAF